MRRQCIVIDRETLCNWTGKAAGYLGRITSRLKPDIRAGTTVFAGETTAKVLAPGTGTKTGYLWAVAREDSPHGGADPPTVAYTYMPGREKVWAKKLLGDFTCFVQCDGYAPYKHIEAPDRKAGPGTLAILLGARRNIGARLVLVFRTRSHIQDPVAADQFLQASKPIARERIIGKKRGSCVQMPGKQNYLNPV